MTPLSISAADIEEVRAGQRKIVTLPGGSKGLIMFNKNAVRLTILPEDATIKTGVVAGEGADPETLPYVSQ